MKDKSAQKRDTDHVTKAQNQSSTKLDKEGNDQNKIIQRSESISEKQPLVDKEKDVCIFIEYYLIVFKFNLYYVHKVEA